MTQEMVTIYREDGRKMGTVSREQAHTEGLWHEVVHCWILQEIGRQIWAYFQQRAHTKKDFPDYYDIASTGHVDAGEYHKDAVLREIREEIGLSLEKKDLRYLGNVKETIDFGQFHDREIVHLYLYVADKIPDFTLGEEVERMVRVKLEDYIKKEKGQIQEIEAYSLEGEKIMIPKEAFCVHTLPEKLIEWNDNHSIKKKNP